MVDLPTDSLEIRKETQINLNNKKVKKSSLNSSAGSASVWYTVRWKFSSANPVKGEDFFRILISLKGLTSPFQSTSRRYPRKQQKN